MVTDPGWRTVAIALLLAALSCLWQLGALADQPQPGAARGRDRARNGRQRRLPDAALQRRTAFSEAAAGLLADRRQLPPARPRGRVLGPPAGGLGGDRRDAAGHRLDAAPVRRPGGAGRAGGAGIQSHHAAFFPYRRDRSAAAAVREPGRVCRLGRDTRRATGARQSRPAVGRHHRRHAGQGSAAGRVAAARGPRVVRAEPAVDAPAGADLAAGRGAAGHRRRRLVSVAVAAPSRGDGRHPRSRNQRDLSARRPPRAALVLPAAGVPVLRAVVGAAAGAWPGVTGAGRAMPCRAIC